MSKGRSWGQLFAEAEEQMRQWRKEHKRATLTQIEQTVDAEMAQVRARIVEELALESELADLSSVESAKRPVCPTCGRRLSANGQGRRTLTTEYEQVISLERSRAYCPHCQVSFFPPG